MPSRFIPFAALSGVLFSVAADAQEAASSDDEQRPVLEITVTRPRIEQGVPGMAVTVISAAEVARSPAASLAELIGFAPGAQHRDLFGASRGARSYVDVRGFGATATQNTLILLNGRRLNDIDNTGVELLNIPVSSIRRIEVLRGNSAAVLYGDGAVGGAVNIVTWSAPTAARVAGAVGSHGLREGTISVARADAETSWALDANAVRSRGWRANNALDQRGVTARVRRFGTGASGSFRSPATRSAWGFPAPDG